MNSPSCSPVLTSSTSRAFERFCSYAAASAKPTPGHLVLAIISEESLGSSQLSAFGLRHETIYESVFGKPNAKSVTGGEGKISADAQKIRDYPILRAALQKIEHASWVVPILERSISIARRRQESSASTQDVVLAMAEIDGPVRDYLESAGVTASAINQKLGINEAMGNALPVDEEFQLNGDDKQPPTPPARKLPTPIPSDDRIPALLDANLNRCREGMRVLDDYCRFVIRSEPLTHKLKNLRHALVTAEQLLQHTLPNLIEYRNVSEDAGTQITTAGELDRSGPSDLVAANSRRVQESLRSLEEFGKLFSSEFCAQIKAIRYESYSLHQAMSIHTAKPASEPAKSLRIQRLESAQLYVLLTESLCHNPWKQVVKACLEGGADILQLREKHLPPREVISRGKWMSSACREAGALFIMNDRPDLAVLADADGVHVGQDDLSPSAVQAIVGSTRLIGLSTHSDTQIAAANLDIEVDYLGVGPVFPSSTKAFEEFPGQNLVSKATEIAEKPWYGIGGIDESNIERIIQSGGMRAAICGAIIGSDNPRQQCQTLRSKLTEAKAELL